jgi:hypothetical protein
MVSIKDVEDSDNHAGCAGQAGAVTNLPSVNACL